MSVGGDKQSGRVPNRGERLYGEPDGPPSAVAATTVSNLAATNYTFAADVRLRDEDENATQRVRFRGRIENRRERVFLRGRDEPFRSSIFAHEYVGWRRRPGDGWKPERAARYAPDSNVVGPASLLRNATVRRVRANETTVVLRAALEGEQTRVAFFAPVTSDATGTLFVHREGGYVRRAHLNASLPSDNTTTVAVYEVHGVGSTTVGRPGGLPPVTGREVTSELSEGADALGIDEWFDGPESRVAAVRTVPG